MDPIAPFLAAQGFVVLDGALATELERRGADLDYPLWSAKALIEAPELIETVHYDYFRAGADVGTSASYQATFEGFAARGLDEGRTRELLRLSVALVRRARDRFWQDPANRAGRLRPLVAASVGCYGAFLHDGSEYSGDYGLSHDELREFHRDRLEVLAESGADLLAFETIPSQREAEALVSLLSERRARPAPPAWMSFSCRNAREVSHGESFSECAAVALSSPQVIAAGVNCTAPRFVSGLLGSLPHGIEKHLVVYPNSGELWDGKRHAWKPGEAVEPCIEERARDWYRLEARILGGCCRTTPRTIERLRRALEQVVADDAPESP
jgi:homocysteine S-methyltransferase